MQNEIMMHLENMFLELIVKGSDEMDVRTCPGIFLLNCAPNHRGDPEFSHP